MENISVTDWAILTDNLLLRLPIQQWNNDASKRLELDWNWEQIEMFDEHSKSQTIIKSHDWFKM